MLSKLQGRPLGSFIGYAEQGFLYFTGDYRHIHKLKENVYKLLSLLSRLMKLVDYLLLRNKSPQISCPFVQEGTSKLIAKS